MTFWYNDPAFVVDHRIDRAPILGGQNMKKACWKELLAGLIVASLVVSLCGCREGMKYHDIFGGAIAGGLIGWIIGHQYDQDGNGALIGAGVGALGGLAKALDELPPEHKEKLEKAANDVRNGNMLLSRGAVAPSVLSEAGL
jgi:hypothetical protein